MSVALAVAEAPAPDLRAVGVVSAPGDGSLDGAGLTVVPTPCRDGERFRRATRECVLAVAAVDAALTRAGLGPSWVAGEETGLVYATAAAYAGANRAFLEDGQTGTLHFPYTSPTAVPGEVTIEYGIRGAYLSLMGGATATLEGLWQAARWLDDGRAARVVLVAVEVFHEVHDLWTRARGLYEPPLVEGAACAVLEPGREGCLRWASAPASAGAVAATLDRVTAGRRPGFVGSSAGARLGRAEARWLAAAGLGADRRPGERLACGPLAALEAALTAGAPRPWLLTGAWRGDYGALLWE